MECQCPACAWHRDRHEGDDEIHWAATALYSTLVFPRLSRNWQKKKLQTSEALDVHVVATILNLGIHSHHRIQRSTARPSRKNSFSPTKGPLPHVEITRQIAFRTLTRGPPRPATQWRCAERTRQCKALCHPATAFFNCTLLCLLSSRVQASLVSSTFLVSGHGLMLQRCQSAVAAALNGSRSGGTHRNQRPRTGRWRH